MCPSMTFTFHLFMPMGTHTHTARWFSLSSTAFHGGVVIISTHTDTHTAPSFALREIEPYQIRGTHTHSHTHYTRAPVAVTARSWLLLTCEAEERQASPHNHMQPLTLINEVVKIV